MPYGCSSTRRTGNGPVGRTYDTAYRRNAYSPDVPSTSLPPTIGFHILHHVVAERAAPQHVHHVQTGTLVREMRVLDVVGGQRLGRDAERPLQELQRILVFRCCRQERAAEAGCFELGL